MHLGRLFQETPLEVGMSLSLDERANHYLATVLRAKMGDSIHLFNGLGGEYLAIINFFSKKRVMVEVKAFLNKEVESPLKISLVQGIARGERMDMIVQKAVELGVFDLMPILTERCNVRLSGEREEKRLAHWQQIAVSACEQSGRNFVPLVHAPQPYLSWLSSTHYDYGFVLSPHTIDRLSEMRVPKTARISLLIGPEGGLTDDEIASAVAKGFKTLNLGPRILRTETATLAALTAVQVTFGDM
jgi:16S rRNA (uracil1498-N3)-methyltransferase